MRRFAMGCPIRLPAQGSPAGGFYLWLEAARWLDRLRSYRGPGESYSDVILRLAAEDA
jgi:hypothetical protein